jgi:alkylated DNA repair dioxygenase AlkB
MQTSLFPTERPKPSGLAYLPDFIARAEEALLLRTIDAQPWLSALKRRVQHYGYTYDYSAKAITPAVYLGPLPDWLSGYAAALRRKGLFAQTPDQAIVNEYRPGQGIAPHIDRAPCFAETVASLSLGSPCVMDFAHGATGQKTSMLLEPCSLLVLSGDARYQWTHAIAPRKTDQFDGAAIARRRRVSLTFRKTLAPTC